jgi:hypothetical protein
VYTGPVPLKSPTRVNKGTRGGAPFLP